jgi:exoribonuclease II
MEIGKIVVFFDQKKILCAICLEAKENKIHLLSEENREITLGPNRIIHSSSTLNPTLSHAEMLQQLRVAMAKQKNLMQTFSMKDLWELVCGEGRGFSLRELTELVFNSKATFDHEMALLRALFEDRLYFKQREDLYEPRDPEKVEQITRQLQEEAEQEREMEEASTWLAAVWAGQATNPPGKKNQYVTWLKEMVLQGPDAVGTPKGKELLHKARIPSEDTFELLVKLGEWGKDENLFLLRYQISQAFPEKVLTEAEQIISWHAQGIPTQFPDRDLTLLHPLTIDSEFTRDIDDALTIERVEGGYQVGIHITDVPTFLNGHKEIFTEAQQRATTIYLPDQRIPMIPPVLSEGLCSLVVGDKRRAISFLVRIDELGTVQDYEIVPSVIQVERRLSYDLVDQLLEEGEEELAILQGIADKIFRRRLDWGAFFIPRPERVVRVNRGKEIIIFKRERESPSQKMVSEFMILANCLAAQFLKQSGIPAIYRSQMEPREKPPPMEKFDPLQAFRLRRIMNRVEVSTRPLRHAGLGVEAYLTLTSPLRRFYDLLNEQQLLGALRRDPILKEKELEEIITQVGPAFSEAGLVEEQTEQYWILRHLEKRIGSTTTAVVLDKFPNRYLVHLNEYILEVDMAPIPGRDFVPGDQILVRVEKANARTGIFKIAPV